MAAADFSAEVVAVGFADSLVGRVAAAMVAVAMVAAETVGVVRVAARAGTGGLKEE